MHNFDIYSAISRWGCFLPATAGSFGKECACLILTIDIKLIKYQLKRFVYLQQLPIPAILIFSAIASCSSSYLRQCSRTQGLRLSKKFIAYPHPSSKNYSLKHLHWVINQYDFWKWLDFQVNFLLWSKLKVVHISPHTFQN